MDTQQQQLKQITLRLATEVRHSIHEIMGFVELVTEEPLRVRQTSFLANCRLAADRLLGVTGDLSELSRQELPHHPLVVFQPAAAIAEIVEIVSALAQAKGPVLECELTPACHVNIEARRELVLDTLRRLLDNAVRYTRDGKIHVSADVQVAGDSASLIVEVSDTGSGLPARLTSFIESKDLGALPDHGLGLAIVRQRVALMQGEISVVSTPGAGTIVRVSLPMGLAKMGVGEGQHHISSGAASPMNLLVAEDSEDGFFVFEGYVRGEGHHLTRAVDGAEAVRLAQAGGYDLIVMDANMPVMDGYAATKAIREWESSTGRPLRTPILLFSADDPVKQVSVGATVGCSGYLGKPATKEEVVRALRFFGPHFFPVGPDRELADPS